MSSDDKQFITMIRMPLFIFLIFFWGGGTSNDSSKNKNKYILAGLPHTKDYFGISKTKAVSNNNEISYTITAVGTDAILEQPDQTMLELMVYKELKEGSDTLISHWEKYPVIKSNSKFFFIIREKPFEKDIYKDYWWSSMKENIFLPSRVSAPLVLLPPMSPCIAMCVWVWDIGQLRSITPLHSLSLSHACPKRYTL